MNSASTNPYLSSVDASSPLDERDWRILQNVEPSLQRAIQLKQWWTAMNATHDFTEQFTLIRAFNRPSSATGFFDSVDLDGIRTPVMGVVQEMLYDRADTGAAAVLPVIRGELREFITRYFMRVSDFRPPQAAIEPEQADQNVGPLSWCSRNEPEFEGFGYSQLYYKLRHSGRIGKFPEALRYQIVDLGSLDNYFEWVVLKVRIFDFNLAFRPLGTSGPAISFPLQEENYIVLHKEFITIQDDVNDRFCGEYGFGYGILRVDEGSSVLAYGPGRFNVGFQTIQFRMLSDGQITAHLVFVVNRPERILDFPLNPFEWGFAFADLLSSGLGSRPAFPFRQLGQNLIPSLGTFDPLLTYIDVANLLTGGEAARRFCISREQLEKEMLVQHFMQHYQMIVGSLLTWRQIPDWLDSAHLPPWVMNGTPYD